MILAIDVGNSNIVMGGYQDSVVSFVSRMQTDRAKEADQYAIQLKAILALYGVHREGIDGIVISCVVPSLTPVLMKALAHLSSARPHLLSLKDAGGVLVEIDNASELGMDILASAIAVRHSRPLPAVIIDMGTATKITAMDKNGQLLGVAISPGLYVSLDALVRNASALQGLSLEAPPKAIGSNTVESMRSGVVLGSAAMLDGMIDRFAAEMGGLASVVATGGAAGVVIPNCSHTIEISETLLLDGMIHAYNHREGQP
ncbi:MAG: type III pantothenate kinase [Ruminococcaceae bacterium]|nr:type III pantothenate kinase [Oscillospiraceae bacterium]